MVLQQLAREQKFRECYFPESGSHFAIGEVWDQDQEHKQGRRECLRPRSSSELLQSAARVLAVNKADKNLLYGGQEDQKNCKEQRLLHDVNKEDPGRLFTLANLEVFQKQHELAEDESLYNGQSDAGCLNALAFEDCCLIEKQGSETHRQVTGNCQIFDQFVARPAREARPRLYRFSFGGRNP